MTHEVYAETFGKIDTREKPNQLWEKECDALLTLLVGKGIMTVDELRRAIEGLSSEHQVSLKYYEKWAVAMANILLETQQITTQDLIPSENYRVEESAETYEIGDLVTVVSETDHLPWPKPHLRTPGYVHGALGEIVAVCGEFRNPELLAYRREGKKQTLYRVKFKQADLWEMYNGPENDTAVVEIYGPWLRPFRRQGGKQTQATTSEDTRDHFNHSQGVDLGHGHSHSHGDGDLHTHGSRAQTEQDAIDKEEQKETPPQIVFRLMKATVLKKNIISPQELRKRVEELETMGHNQEGPRMIARAWVDEDYKNLLLSDATKAAAELGIEASNNTAPTVLTVMENTPQVHNLVVCTLCSCYPRSILGLAPAWYKSRSYRSRAIREPREVLKEFGTYIDHHMRVEVHDSTADLRYMVMPQRPEGTEGWSESELAELVTRDSMIGVTTALDPKNRSS
eukprot:CAMPEP_0197532934 /NCGR_PEP_ID=MMETSP1318-20131121/41557_1 /TAXON_ID=552666 /ORGANISM="Partenskyella glossopodia, Strain RCC365" /LENGTH=452 /DNA_ID=CAMNT_0043089647 /DNA_START=290 /DNA_END=1648 /DNA_ORIENTATION=-